MSYKTVYVSFICLVFEYYLPTLSFQTKLQNMSWMKVLKLEFYLEKYRDQMLKERAVVKVQRQPK